MASSPIVFLETTVLKASVDTRLVLVPQTETLRWGDREITVDVHHPVYLNQNIKFLRKGQRERFEDTIALRFIAALAKEEKIKLLSHKEVYIELMGLPRVFGNGPLFYGAPVQKIRGPIEYERIVIDGTGRDHQYEFLLQLRHPRYLELQRLCGAYQGDDCPPNRNQLIDAFHLFCAESSGADYLLTHDDKLIKAVLNDKTRKVSIKPITPKRLLITLAARHPTWLWAILKERWRIAQSGRKLYAEAQDASREFWS
ncbi:MAG: hypothetical protein WBM28_05230 [Burkholderiales bacterium]